MSRMVILIYTISLPSLSQLNNASLYGLLHPNLFVKELFNIKIEQLLINLLVLKK